MTGGPRTAAATATAAALRAVRPTTMSMAAAPLMTTTTTTTRHHCHHRPWVACNVYVTAGAQPHHGPLLQRLLQHAQEQCHRLSQPTTTTTTTTSSNKDCNCEREQGRTVGVVTPRFKTTTIAHDDDDNNNEPDTVVVVHAYADPVYNRSSFHLAGTAEGVASVAWRLAYDATQQLQVAADAASNATTTPPEASTSSPAHDHPFVGWVDHIAVMPLTNQHDQQQHQDEPTNNNNPSTTRTDSATTTTTTSSSSSLYLSSLQAATAAAQWIGTTWTQQQDQQEAVSVKILPYGHAHPHQWSLARVRREQTLFFQSGGLESTTTSSSTTTSTTAASTTAASSSLCTIGTPSLFVENYNVRTTAHCTRLQAQALTKLVRGRTPGGLVGVEALTLPYSHGRWEVACNLLQVSHGSASNIQQRAEMWQQQQQQVQQSAANNNNNAPPLPLLEVGYRVGTTVDQCEQVLQECGGHQGGDVWESKRRDHDTKVLQQFAVYLTGTHTLPPGSV